MDSGSFGLGNPLDYSLAGCRKPMFFVSVSLRETIYGYHLINPQSLYEGTFTVYILIKDLPE